MAHSPRTIASMTLARKPAAAPARTGFFRLTAEQAAMVFNLDEMRALADDGSTWQEIEADTRAGDNRRANAASLRQLGLI